MQLSEAVDLMQRRTGANRWVYKVNHKYKFICITDIEKFFPDKSTEMWLRLKTTNELIVYVKKTNPVGPVAIIKGRGRNGGTYLHPMLVFDYFVWVSPELRYQIYNDCQTNKTVEKMLSAVGIFPVMEKIK